MPLLVYFNQTANRWTNFPELSETVRKFSIESSCDVNHVVKIPLCMCMCVLSFRLGAHNLLLCVVAQLHSGQLFSTLFYTVQHVSLYRPQRNLKTDNTRLAHAWHTPGTRRHVIHVTPSQHPCHAT